MPPLALTESTQACSPARCSGWADGPEKLPIVPMSRSDPDAATAELDAPVLVLVLVLVPLLLLLLLQAVARAATATLSADARQQSGSACLVHYWFEPPRVGPGREGDWPGRRRSRERWRGRSHTDDEWTVSRT